MYEWDRRKHQENVNKHGLSFEDAEAVFSGPFVTFEDDRQDYGETRYVTLGLLDGRVVVVAHTMRGRAVRIISMRKANHRERKIFAQRLGTS